MVAFHRTPGQGPAGALGRLDSAATVVLEPLARPEPLRYFGSYALVVFETGVCRYRDELGRSHRLESGDVVIVLPRFGHRYEADPDSPEPAEHTYVVFDGPLPELWERTGWLSPPRSLLPQAMPRDGRAAMLDLLDGPDAATELARLQTLLAQLLAGHDASAPGDAWLDRARQLLAAELHQPADLPAIARELGVSYPAFRKRFKHAAGVSPARYRAQRVIAQATQLMSTTDLSDKEIAYQLGFANPYHFSRRFKQLTGEPPTRYRQRLTDPHHAGSPPMPR
ncbi:MAG: helix-turn-helix domain-containing protein [Phycisphaeraceae bacterium]